MTAIGAAFGAKSLSSSIPSEYLNNFYSLLFALGLMSGVLGFVYYRNSRSS